jgi:hypothetical protein
MTDTDLAEPRRRNRDTTAATAARRRGRKERLAAELRDAGWLPVPPERAEEVRDVLAAAGVVI